ncbi:TPA: BspA family leucine-rich repeat surface protein [Enterococcus faecalis]
MKTKGKFISLLTVMVLLANSSIGTVQVLAKEVHTETSTEGATQNSISQTEEKSVVDSSDESPTIESKQKEAQESSTTSSELNQLLESTTELLPSISSMDNSKDLTNHSLAIEEESSYYSLPKEGTMEISWDKSKELVNVISNNAPIDDLMTWMNNNPDVYKMPIDLIINGSLSDAPRTIAPKGSKLFPLQVKKLSGDIAFLPKKSFDAMNLSTTPTKTIIDLPNLKVLGESSFEEAQFSGSSEIHMPALEIIGYKAFKLVTFNGMKLFFPNVIEIGTEAFWSQYTEGATEMDFPKVERVGAGAFTLSKNLVKLNVSNATEAFGYGSNFASLLALRSLDLNKLTAINDYMFQNSKALKEIKVSKVKKIGREVLRGDKEESAVGGVPPVRILKFDEPNFESIQPTAFDKSGLTGILYNGTEHNKVIFDSINNINSDGKRINFYGYKENIKDFNGKKGEKVAIPIFDLPEKDANAAEDWLGIKLFKNGREISNDLLENGVLKLEELKPEDTGTYVAIIEIQSAYSNIKERYQTNEFKIDIEEEPLLWGTSPWSFDKETGELTVGAGNLGSFVNKETPWNRTDDKQVSPEKIKKITFTDEVRAPGDSEYLFSLKNLTEIEGLNKINTSDVEDFGFMFQNAVSLTNLDLSTWITSKSHSMYMMFDGTSNLSSLNVSTWDVKNVTSMSYMFRNASKLKNLDLSEWETYEDNPSDYLGMAGMFEGVSLQSLTLGQNFKFREKAALSSPIAQNEGDKLTGKWIKQDGSSIGYLPADFMKNYGTNDLTAGTYVAEKDEKLLWGSSPWSFDDDTGVLTVETGELADYTEAPWNRKDAHKINATEIKQIDFKGAIKTPIDSLNLFASLENVESINGLENFNTSNTTSMNNLFFGDAKLTTLNLSHFDTSNVELMANMFADNKALTSLDVSSFNTSKVRYMNGMFVRTAKLRSLDLSSFDTSKVEYMKWMFKDVQLEKLTLGENFRFIPDAMLGFPVSSLENVGLTGKWIKQDGSSIGYLPADFMKNYGTNDLTAGTYVADIQLLWGTSPWNFDEETGVLTIEPGELATYSTAPWMRNDKDRVDHKAIKEVVFTGTTYAPKDSTLLLAKLINMEKINGLNNLDTTNVEIMEKMFMHNQSIESYDFSKFNTKNVTNMSYMLGSNHKLKELDLRSFRTEKVTNLSGMFDEDLILEQIDLSSFDTQNVNNFNQMFYNDKKLKTLDLSGFKTFNATTMNGMFFNNFSLEQLDISNFDTSNVTDMNVMFCRVYNLTSLDLSHFDTSKVTRMNAMFFEMKNLSVLDISSFNTKNVEDMGQMFAGVTSLSKLKLGDLFKFDKNASLNAPVTQFTNVTNTGKWIKEDYASNAYLPVDFMASYGSGDLKAGTYVADIQLVWGTSPWNFDKHTGVLTIESGELDSYRNSPWKRADKFKINDPIKKVILTGETKAPIDSSFLFSGLVDASEIEGLNHLVTVDVENMSGMFSNNKKIETYDLSTFKTGKATDMSELFYRNGKVARLDLSNFDTKNVKYMNHMFTGLSEILSLDLSSFNTSNVKYMRGMFSDIKKLKNLDLSSFDTSSAVDMERMFSNTDIQNLDISNFSAAPYMSGMFEGSKNLAKLTLGDSFRFASDSRLEKPVAENKEGHVTGNWIREDGNSKGYAPVEFMATYGTEDLLAGSYVAEVEKPEANLKIDFKASPKDSSLGVNTVGKTSEVIITVKNVGDRDSTAKDVQLEQLETQFEITSEKIEVTYYKYWETEKKEISKDELKKGYKFNDMHQGEEIEIRYEAIPWNNSDQEVNGTDRIQIDYLNGVEENKVFSRYSRTTQIESGAFGFIQVPNQLAFKTTALSINLNNQLIDRVDDDWEISMEDYRGTNDRYADDDDEPKPDRQDWELTATAGLFKDSENNELPTSVLSMVFVKDGQISELGNEEVFIEKHSVKNETPKEHHEINIKWAETEGLKARVHNRNALKTNTNYQAQVDFDLRMAP